MTLKQEEKFSNVPPDQMFLLHDTYTTMHSFTITYSRKAWYSLYKDVNPGRMAPLVYTGSLLILKLSHTLLPVLKPCHI